jgi:transposase
MWASRRLVQALCVNAKCCPSGRHIHSLNLFCLLRDYCGFHLNIRNHRLHLGPMPAYSIDLRQKILRAWARHLGSQRALADLFGVSLACVEKVLRQHRTTGDLAPKPHAGGQKPRLDTAAQAVVQGFMRANPDATLEELCTRAAAETGVRVSVPTMCRTLQRLGLPRKKSRFTRRSATRRASSTRGRTTAS